MLVFKEGPQEFIRQLKYIRWLSFLSAFGWHYPLSHNGKTQALKTLTLAAWTPGAMWKCKDQQQPMENEAQLKK